ncbi:MAG: hypothetical protein KC964_16595, partial [Candidatus Omnitrophica bacterium]|nr:hypothetical protein [Candidatus Omnitrophota bacterium]
GQSLGTNNMVTHLLGKDAVCRLDPRVPSGMYALDKVSTDELIAEAANASLHGSPTFREMFCSHSPRPYKPHYSQTENPNSEPKEK